MVVAVSPGLVPGTGIGKGMGVNFTMEWKGARSIQDGEFLFLCLLSFQALQLCFSRGTPRDEDRGGDM